jgi:DNA helicase IV
MSFPVSELETRRYIRSVNTNFSNQIINIPLNSWKGLAVSFVIVYNHNTQDNLKKLFTHSISPEKWKSNMNVIQI